MIFFIPCGAFRRVPGIAGRNRAGKKPVSIFFYIYLFTGRAFRAIISVYGPRLAAGREKPMEELRSKDNPRIQRYIKLASRRKEREAAGCFVIEGFKLLEEAVLSGIEVESAYLTPESLESARPELRVLEKVPAVFRISGAAAGRLSQSRTPQGVYAVCRIPAGRLAVKPDGKYIGLWGLQDPGNVGTILRTADALGLDGAVLSEGSCDLYSLKVLRAAMGAVFRLPVLVARMEEFLPASGLESYASVVDASAPPVTDTRFPPGCILLIGNEGNGLSAEQVSCCAHRVTIPMKGRAESFNAAMAATIFMWEMACGTGGL